MALTKDLISQFVKVTKDTAEPVKETITYGTVANSGTEVYIDGSDIATPISKTADISAGDRVIIMVKNHTATIIGNLTSPSLGTVSATSMIETLVTNKVHAETVVINEKLTAAEGDISTLKVDYLTIRDNLSVHAAIIGALQTNSLTVETANATYATIENLDATNAEVHNLASTYGDFVELTTDKLDAIDASFKSLDSTYANIDFSNIGKAAMEYFYSVSGLIENVVISEGSITGSLVGVTIRGDIIEGGTVVADKLVLQGEDGLYYKLNTDGVRTEAEQTEYNSLDGSIITAKSITANKLSVDDLSAFDATIGGFSITYNALYSGVKESMDNSTQGIYLDADGQISIGDGDNYLKYYRDEDGVWKLVISAESILFGGESKSSASDIKTLTEHVKVGTYTDPETDDVKPCVELAEGDSDFKQVITNTSTMFMDGGIVRTKVDTDGVTSENVTVKDEFRQGGFAWKVRSNGNLGLTWKGGNS